MATAESLCALWEDYRHLRFDFDTFVQKNYSESYQRELRKECDVHGDGDVRLQSHHRLPSVKFAINKWHASHKSEAIHKKKKLSRTCSIRSLRFVSRKDRSESSDSEGGAPEKFTLPPFGIQLEDIPATNGIPNFLSALFAHILENIKTVGIFRISASSKRLMDAEKTLADKYQKSTDEIQRAVVSSYDVHSCCNLVKMFFRKLSPPIFTWELYAEFVALGDYNQDTLSPLVGKLPQQNTAVLNQLFEWLKQIADEKDNLMSATSLAVVFAPNLLYPKEQTMDTMLQQEPRDLVAHFIEQGKLG